MSDSAAESALLKLVEIQGHMLTDALGQLAKLSQPTTTPTQQLRELLEVAQMLQPSATAMPNVPLVGADGPPWALLVDRALVALERIDARRAAPAPIAAVSSASSLPITAEARRIVLPRKLAAILPHIPTICEWADSGTRPEMRAALVVDHLDAQQRSDVIDLCQMDGFPSAIVSAVPDFAQREAWVIPFLFSLRAALLPQLAISVVPEPGTQADNGAGTRGGR